MSAVIVRVAKETGQDVLSVSRQSFALTLYTLWHLQQWARVESFEAQARAHHAASLAAFAMHEPGKLKNLHDRFLVESSPRKRIVVVDRMARVAAMIKDLAKMENGQ